LPRCNSTLINAETSGVQDEGASAEAPCRPRPRDVYLHPRCLDEGASKSETMVQCAALSDARATPAHVTSCHEVRLQDAAQVGVRTHTDARTEKFGRLQHIVATSWRLFVCCRGGQRCCATAQQADEGAMSCSVACVCRQLPTVADRSRYALTVIWGA